MTQFGRFCTGEYFVTFHNANGFFTYIFPDSGQLCLKVLLYFAIYFRKEMDNLKPLDL